MTIKQLNAEDVGSFRKIRLEALAAYPEAFGSSYAEELEYSNSRYLSMLQVSEAQMVLGYFKENTLVGTIGIMRQKKNNTRHKCFIWGMYVSDQCRGLGYGKALLNEAIKVLEKVDSVTQVNLFVTENNKSALALYKAMGFKEYGLEPNALIINGVSYSETLMYRAVG